MQLRFGASIIIFAGSYLPLSLILLAQDFRIELVSYPFCLPMPDSSVDCVIPFRNAGYSISIFLICLVCFFVTLIVLSVVRPKNSIDVREAKYIPAELMSYTLPYIVSFMSLNYQETGKFVGLAIFLVWIFLITHRSGQIILNPLLIVFGWRLHEIKYVFPRDTTEYTGRALSKGPLEPKKRYRQTVIQDAMIIRPAPANGEP
jgi:hypothetical protein